MRRILAVSASVFLALGLLVGGGAAASGDPSGDTYPSFPAAVLPSGGPERPIIADGTVQTAWHTPIRGAFVSSENINPGDPYMKPTDFDAIVDNGLNAIHLYAASLDYGDPVDFRAAYIDYLVDQSARHGMYIIITVGTVDSRPEVFPLHAQFIHDFWDFYAERYKNEKHVIFEICNEIGSEDPGQTIAAEVDAYQTIRAHAPDSMVLFYSFAVTDAVTDWAITPFLKEAEARIGGVPWTNEAVAFHAYEAREDLTSEWGGETHLRQVIHDFRDAGYPIINTEVPNVYELTTYLDMMMVRVFESEGVSWLAFTEYPRVTHPSLWRGRFDTVGLTWGPDYGSWPVTTGTFPFATQAATTAVIDASATLGSDLGPIHTFTNGTYVSYGQLRFGTREPVAYLAQVKASTAGTLYVRQGGPDGPILGSAAVTDTGSAYTTVVIPLTQAVSGLADISVTYEASSPDAWLALSQWSFALPELSAYQDPYRQYTYVSDYPFRTGNIVRRTSTDTESSAAFEVSGITDGSSLTYDFVHFDNVDTNLRIRAKTLAGGTIEVWVGDMAAWATQVATCLIDGPKGEWMEFVCPLKLSDVLMIGDRPTYWDLSFFFTAKPGSDPSQELFALSQYYFGDPTWQPTATPSSQAPSTPTSSAPTLMAASPGALTDGPSVLPYMGTGAGRAWWVAFPLVGIGIVLIVGSAARRRARQAD